MLLQYYLHSDCNNKDNMFSLLTPDLSCSLNSLWLVDTLHIVPEFKSRRQRFSYKKEIQYFRGFYWTKQGEINYTKIIILREKGVHLLCRKGKFPSFRDQMQNLFLKSTPRNMTPVTPYLICHRSR